MNDFTSKLDYSELLKGLRVLNGGGLTGEFSMTLQPGWT